MPPRLVNDFASLLSPSQIDNLEKRLVALDDSTSNQVVVVIVNSLENAASATAYEIGEKWGVGDSKFNNGVVILIKPKRASEAGEAFIATGYGLEGALPDAICKRIVEREMIPYFKENRYYEGIDNALNIIIPIVSGEYSYKEYQEESGSVFVAIFVLFLVVLFIFFIASQKGGGSGGSGGGSGGSDLLDSIFLGSLLSQQGRGSSSGRIGGSGGGFGGFGGGRFGGGGGGGKW